MLDRNAYSGLTHVVAAILGSSGSGKTSLLNVLADRIHDSRLDIDGGIFFNGALGRIGVEAAYVMQQDVLIPTLTVRETLQYSADLAAAGCAGAGRSDTTSSRR